MIQVITKWLQWFGHVDQLFFFWKKNKRATCSPDFRSIDWLVTDRISINMNELFKFGLRLFQTNYDSSKLYLCTV